MQRVPEPCTGAGQVTLRSKLLLRASRTHSCCSGGPGRLWVTMTAAWPGLRPHCPSHPAPSGLPTARPACAPPHLALSCTTDSNAFTWGDKLAGSQVLLI